MSDQAANDADHLNNQQSLPDSEHMKNLEDLTQQKLDVISSVSDAYPNGNGPPLPEVVSLQPTALIDHVCHVEQNQIDGLSLGELGGSHRVNKEEIARILTSVGEYFSKAGGSASNTLRGLAGFGIQTKIIGARGYDEWGTLFVSSMKRAGVDTTGVVIKENSITGRCCIVSCQGQRTMRTCLNDAARLGPDELKLSDFQGAKWAYLSAYCLYSEGLLERAIQLATEAGANIAMDFGSFEIVRSFRPQLTKIIESGDISVCFCNEDEAKEISQGGTPEDGLRYISKHCKLMSVVTLAAEGCLVLPQGATEPLRQNAIPVKEVVDSTGAGDLFAAGFLYSLIRGMDVQRAAEIGCLAGAAIVQTLGAEMTQNTWHFLHSRMHGPLAGEAARHSAEVVQRELLSCYSLIHQVGRGVCYYGSARLKEDSPHFVRARELGGMVAKLLKVSTWSGGGPGIMQAATLGAMDVGGSVAGIRIAREAGTTVRSASYLPEDVQVICRFLSSRKVALVDAAMRLREEDRTALIFLPGGLGTMDELFEVMTLIQLKKLGSNFQVPLLVVNYDGFFDGLLDFLAHCDQLGTIGARELEGITVVCDNAAAVYALSQFYSLSGDGINSDPPPAGAVLKGSEWAAYRGTR